MGVAPSASSGGERARAGPAAGPRKVRLGSIGQRRAHEHVADLLRREIALGLIQYGEALPPERDLARILGVGRATVQGAVRLLESEGLVQARRGRGGGTFVVAPVGSPVSARRMVERIRRDRERIAEAVSFRLEVEPTAAALAALRRTEEDLDRLRELVERGRTAATHVAAGKVDTQFHVAVVHAARNRFFVDAVEEVRLVLNDVVLSMSGTRYWPASHPNGPGDHGAILRALAAADPRAARAAMARHVDGVTRNMTAFLEAL